ncbi:MAG: selenocysteine-specific translation elongation factor, partial [Clostridiales bacterium]|nr:selenocysteine-specific translation elongation factor [Clostridiales bacterium]
DVPGHEKFIKNMLAGAGGIDLAMLVVAADEGFMLQTVEHLHILTLLGIKDGLVVITKKDMVDEEWLEMMQEEIHEKVKGSFLEGKPVMTVSAYTGEGIAELKDALYALVHAAAEKSVRIAFRLPVDRIFSVDGFGTVVTGTLIEGCMNEGDAAQLVPSGAETRIRNLQVHGKDVKTAYAGQRVAVNLAGLKKTDIARGDAVAKPGSVRVSMMLDVKLRNLKDSGRVITNGMQVHLYHGAAVMLAKVVLLDREALEPGESGYAQLRLTEPIATKNGDRFVVRFYSPLETIGGGVILDDAPLRHKRNVPAVIEALRIKESGSSGDKVAQTVAEFQLQLPTVEKIAAKLDADAETLREELRELSAAGRLVEALPSRYIAANVLDALADTARGVLSAYHKANPLHAGMKPAELRQKLFKNMDQTTADALLAALVRENVIKRAGERYALADFAVHYTKRQTAIRSRLLQYYEGAGIEPASVDEVAATFAQNERADLKQVLDSVLTGGELIMLSPQICYGRAAYERVCAAAKAHFAQHDTITLAELRDSLSTSRKYALAVLEYFDKVGITKKEGDFRRLNRGFPEL